MQIGILHPDAVTLEQVLASAATGVGIMADQELRADSDVEDVPPPYESQPQRRPPAAQTIAPVARAASRREAMDFRELLKKFPDDPFWEKKRSESNKDLHRRTVRFYFQADFCE